MLDTRRLQVLVAVVDAGSISAAAGNLGYTPSAVSQAMAALEREAGTVLLERAGRGVRPTQAGLLLAEHARGVISRLVEAEEALAAFRRGQAGRLRVATFATAGAALVPEALARFRSAHDGVELDLTVADTDEALGLLGAGRIDLAIVVDDGPEPVDLDDALVVEHLLDDPYRVVVPRTHPLARGRRTVDLEELSEDRWIATASDRCNSVPLVEEACSTAGFAPRFEIEADEFSTVLGFVTAGLGVALLPELALSGVPEGVRVLRVRRGEPLRRVFAVTRPSIARQAAVRGMIDALHASAHSHPRAA